METSWECVVVGGGAAGLSAALVLGRARRRTLVVDAGRQSNRPSAGIGGLLGHDGRSPAELYELGRRELGAYPSVTVVDGEVVRAERAPQGRFLVDLADGSSVEAERIVLATGMDYRLPDVAGVRERWGRSVFHCPFCHGWEHRDEPLVVLDPGPSGEHRALLLRMWSDDVTLLTDGPSRLDDDGADRLAAAGVAIDERPVAALHGPETTLTGVELADGAVRPCGGLLVAVTLHQRSPLAEQLGAALQEPNPLVFDAVSVDARSRTSADGVWAAGDVSAQMQSAAGAVAAGHTAGAMVVQSLLGERHGLVT